MKVFLMSGLPNLKNSLQSSLAYIQSEWRNTANSLFKYSSGAYNQNIVAEYPINDDLMKGQVVNRLIYARVLEKGMSSAERMRILETSHQVRRVLKGEHRGSRYLVIPFRHGTPGSVSVKPMPAQIYAQAKQLGYSKRIETYYEYSQQLVNETGRDLQIFNRFGPPAHLGKARAFEGGVPLARRWRYKWADKVEGVGGRYEGMYRMGDRFQTQYITFRTMSEHGKPWAGTKALHIVGRTSTKVKPHVIGILETGFNQDIIDIKRAAGIR